MRRLFVAVICFALSFCFLAAGAAAEEKTLMMATTTSTDNTGLLDYLAPAFTKATGIELRWTATGTGKALKLGQNCDVDILMVHAPPAEKKFVAAGYGVMTGSSRATVPPSCESLDKPLNLRRFCVV